MHKREKKEKDAKLTWLEKQLAQFIAKRIYKAIKPFIHMKSWKTTLGGALIALGAFFQTMNDPEWMQIVGTVLVGLGGLIAGASARDNGVSSEKAGAK